MTMAEDLHRTVLALMGGLFISLGTASAQVEPTPERPHGDTLVYEELLREINGLSNELARTKAGVQDLSLQLRTHIARFEAETLRGDSALSALQAEASGIKGAVGSLGDKLEQKEQALDGRINTLDQRTGKHWSIMLLLVALVAAALVIAYWGLRKLLGTRVEKVGAELERINTDVQAKLVKVDTDFLSSLQKLIEAKPMMTNPKTTEADHSLALKVADEITRIEQNLAQMDAAVRGHKQLTAAVKRMHENLQAAGYQLPALLDKPYDEGMKVTAAFVTDEQYDKDQRIITRVFKPTVLHHGRMIQAGDVQVTQG